VSGGEVNALVKVQGKSVVKGKGKGKSKEGEEVLRDPRDLEPGTIEVSNSSQIFLSRFNKRPMFFQGLVRCLACVKSGYRCFLQVGRQNWCARCKNLKIKCEFPGGEGNGAQEQIKKIAAARAGPLTPRPRQPPAPSAPSGSGPPPRVDRGKPLL
jgi:hypothetical protein